MKTIQLTQALPKADVDRLRRQWLDARHYDLLVRDDTTILKPDGSLLLIYAANVLPRAACATAFDVFKAVNPRSDNRGLASGRPRFQRVKLDGTKSGTHQAAPTRSGTMGFYDRSSRLKQCRATTLTIKHVEGFKRTRGFSIAVSNKFRALAPEQWAVQNSFIQSCTPEFTVPGRAFTSIQVNHSERFAAHYDKGNHSGFGALTVLEGGRFRGCELIFPKFRVAVDVRTGALMLADFGAELHGNAPLDATAGFRLSLVFYARKHMNRCGSVEEEEARAERTGRPKGRK